MTDCARCGDFGYLPLDRAGQALAGWYDADWRLLLRDDLEWVRCRGPAHASDDALIRLQEQLSALLLRRVDEEVTNWALVDGVWLRGRLADDQLVYQQGPVRCLAPPADSPLPLWTLVSAMGVMAGLEAAQVDHHLRRAGLQPLPTR